MKAHRSEQKSNPQPSRSVKPPHSKTWRSLGALCLLQPVFCLCALAQFSIDWHTIDGGGGISTGSVYSVSGTLGQPDAGNMTGGNFVVRGGFWIPAVVQVEGGPWLYIVAEGGTNVVVSWSPTDPGWVLQEALTLQTNWVDSVSGSTNPVSIPAVEAAMFYSLRQE